MIYLDYSATTPVNSAVLESFNKAAIDYPGNANSLHKLGVKSNELIKASTEQIAKILNVAPNEIIYTSGASESNNLAIKGICNKYKNRGKHIITTFLEHSSIIAPLNYLSNQGFEVDFVKIDDNGQVDLEDLKNLMRDDTILVSISMVDSEIGLKQPIQEIANIVKNYPKCLSLDHLTIRKLCMLQLQLKTHLKLLRSQTALLKFCLKEFLRSSKVRLWWLLTMQFPTLRKLSPVFPNIQY